MLKQPEIPALINRPRPLQALILVGVLGAGLLWRSRLLPLSHGFFKYGGDALWALAVFLGAGLFFCRASTWRIALIALGFAWGVEFFQLYHAHWIDALRSTLPGRLILGSVFNAPDLLAYLIGIAFGAAAEHVFNKRSKAL